MFMLPMPGTTVRDPSRLEIRPHASGHRYHVRARS